MKQLKIILKRLKKPSTVISIVSQVISLLVIFGINVQQQYVLAIVTTTCSILITLGILSNPDSGKAGFGDQILKCSNDGQMSLHTWVNEQLICTNCGAVYKR